MCQKFRIKYFLAVEELEQTITDIEEEEEREAEDSKSDHDDLVAAQSSGPASSEAF